jgi:SAM-dependent methyltransferase
MSLGWLDVTNLSINTLLLLEPFHIECISKRKPQNSMGLVLRKNPAITWFFMQSYPPIGEYIDHCLALTKEISLEDEIRNAELDVLNSMHDWLIYVLEPEKYDRLEFLRWDDNSLLEITDFSDKTVVDIGAGTGRLSFTVATYARVVYAIEPVANLRSYLWEKRTALSLLNVYPQDGTMTQVPFPDESADIIMAGHVFGDDCEAEYQEMVRVLRSNGMIILHPGTNAGSEDYAHKFLVTKGFEYDTFLEPGDGLKRKYWKTIRK